MRVVADPSNVSQPFGAEVQVNPGRNEDVREPELKNRVDEDVARLLELQQKAEEEEKLQKTAEDSLNELNEGVAFDAGAQVDEEDAPSGLEQKTEQSPAKVRAKRDPTKKKGARVRAEGEKD